MELYCYSIKFLIYVKLFNFYCLDTNIVTINNKLNIPNDIKNTCKLGNGEILDLLEEKSILQPNDHFKIGLPEKQSKSNIKNELGFIETYPSTKIGTEAPESKAQANIIDYDQDKHVNSENADFFYVNGIMTNSEDAVKTADIVSGIINKPVTNIWSRKEGFLGDLIKAVKIDKQNNLKLISSEINPDIPFNVINSLQNGKNVKIIAHSRGSSETANALWATRNQLAITGYSKEKINKMMSHIEVITMGGLASASDFPSDIKLTQIRNTDDPVPKLNNDKSEHTRNRYSKFELDIETNEKMLLYMDTISNEQSIFSIKDNIKEKLSTASNVFWPEINVATSTAGGLLAGRVILKTLPEKGLSLGVSTAKASANLAGKANIAFLLKDSKVIGVAATKATKLQSGIVANTVKTVVEGAFKISPESGAKTIQAMSKLGVGVSVGGNSVTGVTIGNASRRAILNTASRLSAKSGKIVRVVPLAEIEGANFIKGTAKAFNSSISFIGGSSKIANLESKIPISSKVIAVTGAVVVGASIYYAVKKIGSAHLVNAGSNNYLGQEDIQNFLKKVSSD